LRIIGWIVAWRFRLEAAGFRSASLRFSILRPESRQGLFRFLDGVFGVGLNGNVDLSPFFQTYGFTICVG